jgi:hypothetical protein
VPVRVGVPVEELDEPAPSVREVAEAAGIVGLLLDGLEARLGEGVDAPMSVKQLLRVLWTGRQSSRIAVALHRRVRRRAQAHSSIDYVSPIEFELK